MCYSIVSTSTILSLIPVATCPNDPIYMSLTGQYKQILIGERVDIHPLNLFIGFKMEHLSVMVVSEGVHEEVHQGVVIKSYLPQ